MVNSFSFTPVNTLKALDASCDLPGKTSVCLLMCFLHRVTQSDLFKTFPLLQGDFLNFMLWMLTKPILQPLDFFCCQFLRFRLFFYRQRHTMQECIYRAGSSPACCHCVHYVGWTSYHIPAGKNTLDIGYTGTGVHFNGPALGE